MKTEDKLMALLGGAGIKWFLRVLILTVLINVQVANAAPELVFERDVRPILKAHCFQCHGEDGVKEGGLDLRLRKGLIEGGDSGPAIAPGVPQQSDLLDLIEKGEMPRKSKRLSDQEIETIRRWIELGAPLARPEPNDTSGAALSITEEERQWWAFQPIQCLPPPDDASHPIDAFIIAKLRQKGLEASQEADRQTLVRRAYLDLIGLPPTFEEVSAFVNDTAPMAWERLIDRLLQSTRYGERWGRHWLDAVGYADSEGYNDDDTQRVSAWRYRDYVIESFNENKPFDQFIQEQLAGDELIGYPTPGPLSSGDINKLTATGFLRMAPDGTGSRNMDQRLAQNAVVTETIKIVTSALMGMTVGCAECHDHRYDPILQEDFYRLRAVFEPGLNVASWLEPKRREVSLQTAEQAECIAEVDRKIADAVREYQAKLDVFQAWTLEKELEAIAPTEREFAKRSALVWQASRQQKSGAVLSDEQQKFLFDHPYLKIAATEQQLNLFIQRHPEKVKEFEAAVKSHKERLDQLNALKPKIGSVRALFENPSQPLPMTKIFVRGSYENLGKEVVPGDLHVLAHQFKVDIAPRSESLKTSGRRLALARHLTSGQHPLVARVLMNRFWMHHFGVGIVSTPGNFGRQGNLPTHPELLDWLASKFMASGWDLKVMHKLIMTSVTYKQSSLRSVAAEQIDAANTLYWRANVRRLEAEAIRDSILLVSGQLNLHQFGSPVLVSEDENAQVIVGTTPRSRDGIENRRSVYVEQRRTAPAYQLSVFDAPIMEPNCEARSTSTVAPQSLLLLNSAFVVEQSQALAARVKANVTDSADARQLAAMAWQLAFASSPAEEDLQDMASYLEEQSLSFAAGPASDNSEIGLVVDHPAPAIADAALASLCQALLGANQFLYVD